jgi:putative oxygen-independent coproporphyrinogen III oxidase
MTAIYIHYPYCKSKCPYCDFNSHVAQGELNYEEIEKAYLKELDNFYEKITYHKITSIFFGGGTPSLMPVKLVASILNKIRELFIVPGSIEITLEANPTSVELAKLKDLKNAGINRLSLGIQSLNDDDLKFLGREHNGSEARKAIEFAGSNFDNFSFDLIYARPNQTLKSWQEELNEALKIGSPHLSLYQLTIEKGTKFYSQYKAGEFELPGVDLKDDLYDLTGEIAKKHGLEIYEVSNYAKPGFESKHNLNYWNYGDYIGIGAGAHSRFSDGGDKKFSMTYHNPEKWLKEIQENGNSTQQEKVLEKDDVLKEMVMMGLRTKHGINEGLFLQYFKKSTLEYFGKDVLKQLADEELILANNSQLVPTLKGIKLVNSIYSYLLD